MNNLEISALIKLTQTSLRENLGLSDDILRRYEWHGFRPMERYFIENEQLIYSAELGNKFVEEYYHRYENGQISGRKFRFIRKAASLVDDYYQTGTVRWRKIIAWNHRSLRSTYFKSILDEFVFFHEQNGIYSASTIYGYRLKAFEFMTYLEQCGHEDFTQVTVQVIAGYIPYLTGNYSRSINCMITALRCFLAFLRGKGLVSNETLDAVEVTAARQRRILPGFTEDEVQAILSQPDRSSPKGKRDYAMMLLAKSTGMRTVDILNLRLDDIDWRSNEIRIIQQKTVKPLILPLTAEIGNALADYILHGRQQVEQPHVFLRMVAPYTKLQSSTALGYIVVANMRAAGVSYVSGEWKRVHSFRRYVATKMLEAEVPITTIAQVLGQHNPDSTKPYLSSNLEKLRSCTLNLNGIGLCGGVWK